MARKNSYITVTDQFCGAGGSSQGVRRLAQRSKGGLEVKLALNHWKLAIETHNTNFPDTQHDCTDISACDPRRYLSTDILITSPECTTHSPAGGNNHKALKKQMDMFAANKIDPATERSRATMWDVCRFAEYHQYNAIIVENVVEAKTRWPLFDVWLLAMHKLGYDHKCVYLNSMHCHPTPQSRDRMYIVFWKKTNKAPMLEYMPMAFCPKCSKDVNAIQTWKNPDKHFGKYKQQYVYCCSTCTSTVEPYYYAAFNCIDWSDRGTRIGDRKSPLSPNTIKRIEFGLEKYGSQPLQVINYSPGYTKGIFEPTGSVTTSDHHGILTPFVVNTLNGKNDQCRSRSVMDQGFAQTTYNWQMLINSFVLKCEHGSNLESARHIDEALQTQVTRQTMALVSHPFIINDQHSTGIDFRVKSATDHIPTIPTQHLLKLVTPPFLTESHATGKARAATDPVNTVTAGGIKTGIVTNDAWNSFLSYNYNGVQTSHITEATDAVTTKDRMSLLHYRGPNIEDFYYRMLKPPEVKLAMAFDRNYIILGSGKDQVKQCGNAVTPPAMEWLVQQVVASLN